MATKLDDFVSVAQAAKALGLTDGRVRQLVGSHEGGMIKARKFSERAWMIPVSELRRYAEAHGHELREEHLQLD